MFIEGAETSPGIGTKCKGGDDWSARMGTSSGTQLIDTLVAELIVRADLSEDWSYVLFVIVVAEKRESRCLRIARKSATFRPTMRCDARWITLALACAQHIALPF
jgi:hypothetical protein